MAEAGEITELLKRVKNGDAEAEAELLARVYPDLKRIAANRLWRETPGHGLQVTELVNEAYMRIFGSGRPVDWQNRAHFFAVIAQQMRNILMDQARQRHRGGPVSVALDDAPPGLPAIPDAFTGVEVLALDNALQQLEAIDSRAARVVVMRFFGGLTLEETAKTLNIPPNTAKRDWRFAKAWLYEKLKGGVSTDLTQKTPERRKEIDRIFQEALELKVSARLAFLNQACADDSTLRREVEAQLMAYEQSQGFLEAPAEQAAAMLADALEWTATLTDEELQDVRQPSQLKAGELLDGRYLIERVLGKGAFGGIYLARDTKLDLPVAVKLQSTGTQDSQRDTWIEKQLKDETIALLRIRHPNIVQLLDAGKLADGRFYLVMEYITGESLRSAMSPEGMDFGHAASLLRQLGQALTAIHQQGIIHCDLKPENIMLQRSGDEDLVKLIDFGIAKVIEAPAQSPRETSGIAGTPSYMAPEQVIGKPSFASDTYSLGVIAYEMLTGRRPFPYDSIYQLHELQRAEVKVNPRDLRPSLPGAAQAAILKALSFAEHDRYSQAKDFTESLAQALTAEVVSFTPPPSISIPIKSDLSVVNDPSQTDSAIDKLGDESDKDSNLNETVQRKRATRQSKPSDLKSTKDIGSLFSAVEHWPVIANADPAFDEIVLAEERNLHAVEKVERFVQAFGKPYRELAYHVALPLVLTPELVNHIRTEFLLDRVGWVAEADLLLSDLCREVGYETYVLDEDVRALLLKQGRESLGDQRMKEVAHRVYNYLSHVVYSSPLLTAEDLKAERWQAMVYLDHHREAAAKEMAASFAAAGGSAEQATPVTGGQSVNWGELARIAHLVRGVQEQLLQDQSDELARLVEYAGTAKQIADLRAGTLNPSELQLQNLAGQVEVFGTKLVSLNDLVGLIGLGRPIETTPVVRPEQSDNVDLPTKLMKFLDNSSELNRAVSLREFVSTLLERERIPENVQARLLEGLARIAFQIQGLGIRDKKDDEPQAMPKVEAQTFLSETLLNLAVRLGILSISELVSFTHQVLQKYFAAKFMDGEIRAGRLKATDIWRPENWWKRTNWEETAILLAGFYSDDCSTLVEWIAEANPEIAAQCVARSGAAPAEATKERLRTKWIPRLTDLKNDPEPQARAAVGRALAITGWDNRQGIGVIVRNGVTLPDFDWVRIPAGKFQYGDATVRGDAKPQKLSLPEFFISRFPVTYAQFQTFVDDPKGIADARWFEGLTDDDSERQPGDQAFKFGNHPRETVSWYQAMAFCRWLSWRMGATYDLKKVADWAVRLPTEFEWEKAARGTDGRLYPYEGEFDPKKSNVYDTGIGQTSAVGIFPNGASPYGVEEMSGNVLEWCLSDYRKPQTDARKENLRKAQYRVLRGGSWFNVQLDARAVYRYNNLPAFRVNLTGFRLVVLRPPSS
ncbi:MAG TPA: ECF-type sigma factor [Blastocatellia bacterium]|nr:ECF-type sigma factor [Blastocatellia bacterium]